MWFQRIIALLEEIRDRVAPPRPPRERPKAELTRSQCRHCGTTFPTGPRSGRRLDAVFCCDQHRSRYNSLKRSPKPPDDGTSP
jgi:hypothetical protein